MKTQTQELEKYSKEQQLIAQSFLSLKGGVDLAVKRLNAVKITDDVTLKMADQALSLANEELKKVNSLHKELKEPVLGLTRQIDGNKNELKDPLEAGIKHAKEEKLRYVSEEEKRKAEATAKAQAEHEAQMKAKQAEMDRLNNLRTKIINFENIAITEINSCNDGSKLTELADKYIKDFPKKEFQEFAEVALNAFNNILAAGKARRAFIIQQEQLAKSQDEVSKQQAEIARQVAEMNAQKAEHERFAKQEAEAKLAKEMALIEEEMAAEALRLKQEEISGTETKGLVRKMKAEVIDFSQVPDEFKMLDQVKVNEYLKNNKDILVDGETKMGFRFYIETTARIQ